jgi:hypothetical protein
MNYHSILNLPSAAPGNRKSLANWLDGVKPLVEEESQHLKDPGDLAALASINDSGLLDRLVELGMYKVGCGKVRLIQSPGVQLPLLTSN